MTTNLKMRLANGARYATGILAGITIALAAGQGPAAPSAAPSTVHVSSTSAHLTPKTLTRKVKPGTVRTSANRVAKIDKRGCLFLTYAEAGDPSASDDPTDGIVLCEK